MAHSNASKELSPGCGILFSGVFLLFGGGFLGLMCRSLILPEWRANNHYVEHTCVILDKRLIENDGEDGPTYRPVFLISYTVNGQEYQTWTYEAQRISSGGRAAHEKTLQQFSVSQQYPCWYDPDDPSKAVLVLGYNWFWHLFVLIPLLFVIAGVFGLYSCYAKWGKSPEAIAATASGGGAGGEFPGLPNIRVRPGRTLAHSLPVVTANSWLNMFLVLLFALFWNGIVSVFVGIAVVGFLQGQPEYCLTIFIIPFAAVGIFLIVGLFQGTFLTAFFRPAIVEVSAHPLAPEDSVQLLISHRGPLRLRKWSACVVCEEIARHVEGEDTKTDTKRIHETIIAANDTARECRGRFEIPETAMHSFQAKNNEIQWKVVIHGKAILWMSILWEYPFVVRPASNSRSLQ